MTWRSPHAFVRSAGARLDDIGNQLPLPIQLADLLMVHIQ